MDGWSRLDKSYRVRYYFRMKVTVKGQITIPQALRERFGLHPGTEVGFVAEADALRIQPRKRGSRMPSVFDSWLVKAAGSARTKLTTDQIMAATRGED
jgi:AbrB family looped-hinge helix DNA binding protein